MKLPFVTRIVRRLLGKAAPDIPAQDEIEAVPETRSESDVQFAELQAQAALLAQKVDALTKKVLEKRKGNGLTRTAFDKILYLPSGRVRSVPGDEPLMDFEVTERTAALLNLYTLALFDQGHSPWLDLMHDKATRIFDVRKFEYEPAGVFAIGNYTLVGRTLRNAGRISGVSISGPILTGENDDKAMCGAFDVEISHEAANRLRRVRMTGETWSNMGGVLIDGVTSALQPY